MQVFREAGCEGETNCGEGEGTWRLLRLKHRDSAECAPRVPRVVQTLEDEKKETAAATKISAVMKGHVARTRLKRSLSFGSAFEGTASVTCLNCCLAESLSVGDRVRVGTEVDMLGSILWKHPGSILAVADIASSGRRGEVHR